MAAAAIPPALTLTRAKRHAAGRKSAQTPARTQHRIRRPCLPTPRSGARDHIGDRHPDLPM